MRRPIRHFPNLSDLVDALSDLIVARLTTAVADRGRASLVLPGGRTPKHLFDGLAGRHAPWARVSITLSDERWAPQDPAASNERLLRERLLRGRAAAARFTSFRQADDLAASRDRAEAALLDTARPFDVTVLGMGVDGHVASLFPRSATLHAGALVEAVHCPGAPGAETRLTLTSQALQESRFIALLITGPEKLRALAHAEAGAPTPVSALLRAHHGRFEVFCAP
jgi:6-phosphogluconolactonase